MIDIPLTDKTLDRIEQDLLSFASTITELEVFTFVDFFCNECFTNWHRQLEGLEELELDEQCPNCSCFNTSYHKQLFTK